MANKKFVDLTALVTMADSVIIPVSDGATKKMSGTTLTTYTRSKLSATNASASGSGGSLAYDNSTGVVTFTPALNIAGNAATVTNGVYTTDTGTVTNTMLAGSIANAKLANSSVTVNGTSIALGASGTVTADAATLTGNTLASGIILSSLTTVGTLNSLTVTGTITRSGAGGGTAWGLSGVGLKINSATYTDTSSSGTVANNMVNVLGSPTLAASTTTTYTNAANLYVLSPAAGTNVTITNPYALYVSGNSYTSGTARTGSISSTGGVINITPSASGPTLAGTTTAGLINSSSYVTQATMPSFRVYGSGTTSNLTTTQNTYGALNSNNWTVDHTQGTAGLNSTTGVFTAPVAGLYQVNVVGRNAGYSSGISQLGVAKNGTSGGLVGGTVIVMLEFAASSTMNHAGVGTTVKLAVNDTLALKVLAGQINFDGNDSWSVTFLG